MGWLNFEAGCFRQLRVTPLGGHGELCGNVELPNGTHASLPVVADRAGRDYDKCEVSVIEGMSSCSLAGAGWLKARRPAEVGQKWSRARKQGALQSGRNVKSCGALRTIDMRDRGNGSADAMQLASCGRGGWAKC